VILVAYSPLLLGRKIMDWTKKTFKQLAQKKIKKKKKAASHKRQAASLTACPRDDRIKI
jgi:hypothetical protein